MVIKTYWAIDRIKYNRYVYWLTDTPINQLLNHLLTQKMTHLIAQSLNNPINQSEGPNLAEYNAWLV